MFGEAEAKALFLAIGMLTGFTEPGPTHDAAHTALEKVRAVLPKATLAQVEALQAVLGFYNMERAPFNLDDPKFLQLQQALQERRVVQLQYHAQHDNQITERSVEPLRLTYLDNVWVLHAYCRLRHDQRAFRLDRIDKLQLTRETFAVQALRVHRLPEEGTTVTVRVDAAVVRWVRESQYFAFVDEEVEERGGVLMRYRVRDFGTLASWLLRWGEQVEVLAPLAMRQEMERRVRGMAMRYSLK